MKRAVLAVFLSAAFVSTASADVTLKQSVTGKGLGMSGKMGSTTYIRGLKMRSDTVLGDATRSMIFDIDAQKLYIFDSKKKEAEVWDMAAFAAEMGKTVETSDIKASLKPNGQTKTISGKTANGYDMEISMPASPGGNKDMKMTVTLKGPMWVVKDAPGAAEYLAFYKAAAEKGWIFSDPRAAKAAYGQARSLTEMYRQLAATGGVPYEMTFDIKMSGEGPMAAIMGRVGGVSSSTTVESIETGAVADTLFAVPAGYKLNERK
jgi:hypothetical protein